jgi:hypothetical protein
MVGFSVLAGWVAEGRLLGSLSSLQKGRCPDLPRHGRHDEQNAENTSPSSLREKTASCYKQEYRANSANAGQHEDSGNGEQHRHHGNNQSKQAIHANLRQRTACQKQTATTSVIRRTVTDNPTPVWKSPSTKRLLTDLEP